MALKFVDGCDGYAATSDLVDKWQSAGAQWSYQATAGRFGGPAIQATTTGGSILLQRVGVVSISEGSPICYGFWFKGSALPSAASDFINHYDQTATICSKMRLTTAGALDR